MLWGFDFMAGRATAPLSDDDLASAPAPGVYRWVHLNLANDWSRRWLAAQPGVEGEVAEVLLAADGHQHVRLAGRTLAFAVLDFERQFAKDGPSRTAIMVFLVTPDMMITARHDPLCCPDIILRRIEAGAVAASAASAIDLVFAALLEVAKNIWRDLAQVVQAAEDALIDHGRTPDPRLFVDDRRRAVLLHRQLDGLRSVLRRLDLDGKLPADLRPTIDKVFQRVVALDGDVAQVQRNIRQLREEIDTQTANRTNQNLYVLSILSALLLPPTLVSSFFGMNTGGLPWMNADWGTWSALLLMFVAMVIVVLWLYRRGFFRD